MYELLIKLLASIKMRDENKVLIVMSLKTDESIFDFANWMKLNYPTDEYIERDQDIIAAYASLIAKEKGINV